ncbi:MAG: class I SAM-dependent methyltransferase [Ktedonobacterales bacterium]
MSHISHMPPHYPLDENRLRRRASFNTDASLYDTARPNYPESLFDDLILLSGIPAAGEILEIGSGTGKATLPLARRGFAILGIELGDQMAALAREKLAAYPKVRIEIGAFEEWPVPDGAFDLAVSASAWHWIDPAIGYKKVAQALKPSGSLALLWSSQRRGDNAARDIGGASGTANAEDDSVAFTLAFQEVADRVAPQLAQARADRRDSGGAWRFVRSDALEASGFFKAPEVRTYTWGTTYDTTSYLRLLDSYSSYRVLDVDLHEQLFDAIGEVIEARFGGRVTRQWRAELYVAERR